MKYELSIGWVWVSVCGKLDLLDRWLLEEGTTKNGESRKVHMTTEVFELLRACVSGKSAYGFVFTREDGSYLGT